MSAATSKMGSSILEGRLPVTRRTVGKAVYTRFNRKITNRMKIRTKEAESKIAQRAADLAYHMPFVTEPFRNNGILYGRNTPVLYMFRPNLWAQDYAHYQGSLGKMDIFYAVERGEASGEYLLDSSRHIHGHLKKYGKSPEDFLRSITESALIESAYQARLSGKEMEDSDRRKIDIALVARSIKSGAGLRQICNSLGVDVTDPIALLQISDTLDLTGILSEMVDKDPYFKRRRENIVDMSAFTHDIDSERSNTKAAGIDDISSAIITRALGKKGAEPWLVKKIMQLFDKEA
jgi:hypothetical protein